MSRRPSKGHSSHPKWPRKPEHSLRQPSTRGSIHATPVPSHLTGTLVERARHPRLGARRMTEIELTVNGRAVVEDGRAAAAAVRLPPPRLGAHRHPRRLRARRLRRVHGAARRRPGARLPARSPSRPTGTRSQTVESLATARPPHPLQEAFQRSPRPAVRLLHARDPDGGGRSPVPRRSRPTEEIVDMLSGQPLPLHGLRPDRRLPSRKLVTNCHELGRTAREPRGQSPLAAERHPEPRRSSRAITPTRNCSPGAPGRGGPWSAGNGSPPSSATASTPRSSTGPASGPAPCSFRSRWRALRRPTSTTASRTAAPGS